MTERTRREFLKDATLLGAGITGGALMDGKLLGAEVPAKAPGASRPALYLSHHRRVTHRPADRGHYWMVLICFSDAATIEAGRGWKLT